MRFDAKARVEANFFWDRYYRCTFLCETCMACQPTAKADPGMNYRDFRAEAPHRLTCISHSTYLRTCSEISPWAKVDGWTLGTAFRDPMHAFYLRIFRDLIPSLLAELLDHDCLEPRLGSREQKLRTLSLEMHRVCRENGSRNSCRYGFPVLLKTLIRAISFVRDLLEPRLSIRRRCFILSNTGLGGSKQEYAELGSVWKAAEVKTIVWFLAQKAVALASKSDVLVHAHLA